MDQIVQGTDAWKQIRLGKVTASRMADLAAKTKTGYGASRANYMAELIAERLTNTAAESYTNAAMQWGLDHEADAKTAYEFRTDHEITPVGFVMHPRIADSGASPDGLIREIGLVEIKCPNTATHIDTLITQTIPGKYITQMQWQMACTERKWCDYVSFDPRMPENMRLFIQRVQRDDVMIHGLENEVHAFLSEMERKLNALREIYPQ